MDGIGGAARDEASQNEQQSENNVLLSGVAFHVQKGNEND